MKRNVILTVLAFWLFSLAAVAQGSLLVTGIVKDRAIDKQKNLYANHPYTGSPIQGFQVPQWQEAMDMVKQAATMVPEMGYVGWDVAFSDKGPVLVEGNNFPGHDIYQLPEHTPDKIGMYPKFLV